jgi:8-oxo-dGTP pyrophosphatase MutT (NUDIX family)
MIRTIADFASTSKITGAALALQDNIGRYLFVLAGIQDRCPPGELFYAGVGGHKEEGEDWVTCANREALEEIGTSVEILSAPLTWHVSQQGSIQQLEIVDRPRPFILYEVTLPPDKRWTDELYPIVIYHARLRDIPRYEVTLQEELQGILALTTEQVIQGLERKLTLGELIEEGASVLTSQDILRRQPRLSPIGTAIALAHVLPRTQ